VLYYAEDIPDSHDSNHACVLRADGDLDEVVADIAAFYTQRRITPRMYHLSNGDDDGRPLRAALVRAGFQVDDYDNRYFVHRTDSAIQPTAAITVAQETQPAPDVLEFLHRVSGPWTMKVVRSRLGSDTFGLFIGRLNGKPVATASLLEVGPMASVDDVMTDPAHRGSGYARAVVHTMMQHHARSRDTTAYLYADNPTAIRIYEEAGFVDIGAKLCSWAAWRELSS
jgi:ribosomal protein S18 acetylase RimI-like enzyme